MGKEEITMHEMPYVKSALASVLAAAKGKQVKRIKIEVGANASDLHEFRELFFMMSEGTVAGTSKLELTVAKPFLLCHSCNFKSEMEYSPIRCNKCGSPDIETNANDVKVVEIETE